MKKEKNRDLRELKILPLIKSIDKRMLSNKKKCKWRCLNKNINNYRLH
jgi:hypothetical protein